MWKKLFERANRPAVVFFLLLGAFFYLFPLLSENVYLLSILSTVCIYIIFATSWDVFAGYTNLMNFGHALFVGLAGYLTAFLDIRYGIQPVVALIFSAILCGFMGLFIGIITLRLRGPYFAMITISFAAVAHESSIMFSEVTGGEEGIPGLSSLTSSWTGDYYFILCSMTVIFLLLLAFTRGRYGLLLKAISENEDAVLASGINTPRIKYIVYAISGASCGVGGSLYAYALMQVGPNSLEQILSTTILIMAIVGGMGTIIGPFVGALLLVVLNELLRGVEEYRLLTYTALVVVIIFFAPKGIVSYARPIADKVRFIVSHK